MNPVSDACMATLDLCAVGNRGPAFLQTQLDSALRDGHPDDDAAAFGTDPSRLALVPGTESLTLAADLEARADGNDLNRVAGGKPLAAAKVGLAQALARSERAVQRAPESVLRVHERHAAVGEIDFRRLQVGGAQHGAGGQRRRGDEAGPERLDGQWQVDVPRRRALRAAQADAGTAPQACAGG